MILCSVIGSLPAAWSVTVSEKVKLFIAPHPVRFTTVILTHEATAVITELVIFAECYVII
jgi:hypothetical protein